MEVHLDVHVLTIIAGTIIPILVGIVTKASASAKVKAAVNVVLSIAAGFATAALAVHGDVTADVFIAWLASVATYYGFWKPIGVAPKVQAATANVGIG